MSTPHEPHEMAGQGGLAALTLGPGDPGAVHGAAKPGERLDGLFPVGRDARSLFIRPGINGGVLHAPPCGKVRRGRAPKPCASAGRLPLSDDDEEAIEIAGVGLQLPCSQEGSDAAVVHSGYHLTGPGRKAYGRLRASLFLATARSDGILTAD